MTAQVAADLRAAADMLERDGWTRLNAEDEHGRCALGALAQVAEGQREEDAYGFLRAFVTESFGIEGVSLWNDFHAEDAAEVITALRTAADRAEADQ